MDRADADVALYGDEPDEAASAATRAESLVDPAARPKKSQGTRLVELAQGVDLFHSPDHEGYATVEIDAHRETWPIKSKGFRRWLSHRFFETYKTSPSAQGLQDAINVLEGRALFKGPERRIHVRLAEHDGAIYLDLTNPRWEVIKITSTGWAVIADSPVKFRRARGMLPLPNPVPGGSVTTLRPFLNLDEATDHVWVLLVAWLLAAFRPRGPYPVMVLHGEQGSAKSVTVRLLRSLVDPSTTMLRSEPREIRDVMIAANNGWLLAFDNMSHIESWFSDTLCRLSTGGGFSTRELYSDSDEMLFDAQRPAVLNGIEELATRGDLLDRAIVLYLPTIPDGKRRSEESLWSDFGMEQPHVLGALLTVVSDALRRLPSVRLDGLPRMADFALWIAAAEPALGWPPGTFMAAYQGNRGAAHELVLESSVIAGLLRELVPWSGTSTALLTTLTGRVDPDLKKSKIWPKTPRAVSNQLRRLAPNLRGVGIDVRFDREARTGRRLVSLEEIGNPASPASPCVTGPEQDGLWGDAGDDGDASAPTYSKQSDAYGPS